MRESWSLRRLRDDEPGDARFGCRERELAKKKSLEGRKVTSSLASEQWHTRDWFTSPWNFAEEVTGAYELPGSVIVHDTTLRDGEQQAGVLFTAIQKLRIAEALADAGVQRIEAGMPAVSSEDEAAIKSIVAEDLPSEVYVLSRCMKDDVQRAVDCGVDGVVMEIPASRHLVELGYRWTVERALALCVEATSYAASQGVKVAFFPVDASRAGMDEFLELIRTVSRDGHMDSLGLVDTFGVLTPGGASLFARKCREFNVPLEAHFHMDFSLGVANSCAAVAAGATVVHATVGGLGERAGNTPLEDVALALLTMYGVSAGLDTTKFSALNKLVMGFAGVSVPPQRGIVGSRLFQMESGMVAGWYENSRSTGLTEVFPYDPALVGRPDAPEVILGKGSGPDSIAMSAERVGVKDLSAIEVAELLRRVKVEALGLRRCLTLEEFKVQIDKLRSGEGA